MFSKLSSRGLLSQAKSFSSKAGGMQTRIKHKTPEKRASTLLSILKQEEFSNMKNGRQWPDFRAGDSIEIEELPYATATTTDKIRGVVIGKYNRASDTAVEIVNVSHIIMYYIYYNVYVYNGCLYLYSPSMEHP